MRVQRDIEIFAYRFANCFQFANAFPNYLAGLNQIVLHTVSYTHLTLPTNREV